MPSKLVNILSLLILSLFINGCFSTKSYNEYLDKVTKPEVKWENHSELVSDLKQKSKREMWTEDELERKLTALPDGGYLYITVKALTIDAANPKYWRFIVQDHNGNEILRQDGDDVVANYEVTGTETIWSSIDLVGVDQRLDKSFNVFVIDRVDSQRFEFTIQP